jgi:hypothetical protein
LGSKSFYESQTVPTWDESIPLNRITCHNPPSQERVTDDEIGAVSGAGVLDPHDFPAATACFVPFCDQ